MSVKLIGRFSSLLSALVLLVVILLTAIEWHAFDLNFFHSEYRKLNSTEIIGISEQELMDSTRGLLAYIKGERDDLSIEAVIKGRQRPVFNQREIQHMADVQRLYAIGHWLRNTGLVLFFLLLGVTRYAAGKKFLKFWAGGYLAGAAIFIVLLGAIALAISQDFLWFWNSFHYLIFTNDLWQLDPQTDILIQMVPEEFFFDLVLRILFSFTVVMVGLAVGSGIVFAKKTKVSR